MNNHCDGRDIREPIPTITAGDGHFGEVRAFLVKYYGDATGQDIKAPLDTVTTKEHWFADAGTARTIWMPGISG